MLLLVSHAAGSHPALPFPVVAKHPAGSCLLSVPRAKPALPCPPLCPGPGAGNPERSRGVWGDLSRQDITR